MSDKQLRHDSGKPQMSYLLGQRSEATMTLFGIDRDHSCAQLLEDLCAYMRADLECDYVLSTIADLAKIQGLDLVTEVAKVYEYGGTKYPRGNYLKGQTVSHYLDSAVRHLKALIGGEYYDAESGKHHLAHIWWNVERSGDQSLDRDDRLYVGNKNLETKPTLKEQVDKIGVPHQTIKGNGNIQIGNSHPFVPQIQKDHDILGW